MVSVLLSVVVVRLSICVLLLRLICLMLFMLCSFLGRMIWLIFFCCVVFSLCYYIVICSLNCSDRLLWW